MIAHIARRPHAPINLHRATAAVAVIGSVRNAHATAKRDVQASPAAPQPAPTTSLKSLLLPSFAPRDGKVAPRTERRKLATVNTNLPLYAPTKPDVTAEVSGQENVDRLRKTARDFRSDTFTMPSDDQVLAALKATRGDNVYKEDATTAALEERIAKMAGKEAALFGASGTMTNQLAIRTHMKQPPHSVITDHRAHVHKMEAGGIALFTQATTHGLVPANGMHLTLEDIEPQLQLGEDIHIAPTKLICLENTLSGIIFPQDEIVRIANAAKSHGIAMHLDGARAWNVAAAEIERRGLDATSEADRTTVLSELLAPFDSASLCLSKGMGAPIGSAIVGTKEFIARARWFWKMFGGGWRQSGMIASMADYGLTNYFPRLAYTHALARRLADGLEAAGCDIIAPVDTNMVFFDPSTIGFTVEQVSAALAALDQPITLSANRCVIHHQTSIEAVDDFVAEVKRLAASVPQGQHTPVKKATSLGY